MKVTYFTPKKRPAPGTDVAEGTASPASPSPAAATPSLLGGSSSSLLPGPGALATAPCAGSQPPSDAISLLHPVPPPKESPLFLANAHSVLKQKFGFQAFRGPQLEVIESVMQGRDCLLVMATGAGKSLCYQLPPLLKGQTALVVSPLVSLMNDQVMALEAKGIPACALHASAAADVAVKAFSGRASVVYITPEGLPGRLDALRRLHQTHGVCLVAVDEAHCVSEWGHDFRPDYRNLARLHDALPSVPFLAVTATATDAVCRDIVANLCLASPLIVKLSFDRPNLFYDVKPKVALRRELPALCEAHQRRRESMLVYCGTIKEVDDLAADLAAGGVQACRYHSNMSDKERQLAHSQFQRDDVFIVVATVAFGMGIDKASIRTVVHASCPKSVEQYYQETGRAGRDGLAARCVLFGTANVALLDFYCKEAQSAEQRAAITEKLQAMKRYVELQAGDCRRRYILRYFGEARGAGNCGACDNCTSQAALRDFTEEATLLLQTIQATGQRMGLLKPIDILRGSKAAALQPFFTVAQYGKGAGRSKGWWKALGLALQQGERFLREEMRALPDGGTYSAVVLGAEADAVLQGRQQVVLPLPKAMQEEEEEDARRAELQREAELVRNVGGAAGVALYDALRDVRKALADQLGGATAPQMIVDDPTLQRIAKARPGSVETLCAVEGVAEASGRQHGPALLAKVAEYCEEHDLPRDTHCQPAPRLAGARKAVPQPPLPADQLAPALAKYSRGAKSHMETYELFVYGKLSVEQIAAHRGVKASTILGHLATSISEGYPVDLLTLGLTEEKIAAINAKAEELGDAKLTPLKEALPPEVTWEDLRLVLAHRKGQAESPPAKRPRTSEEGPT